MLSARSGVMWRLSIRRLRCVTAEQATTTTLSKCVSADVSNKRGISTASQDRPGVADRPRKRPATRGGWRDEGWPRAPFSSRVGEDNGPKGRTLQDSAGIEDPGAKLIAYRVENLPDRTSVNCCAQRSASKI